MLLCKFKKLAFDCVWLQLKQSKTPFDEKPVKKSSCFTNFISHKVQFTSVTIPATLLYLLLNSFEILINLVFLILQDSEDVELMPGVFDGCGFFSIPGCVTHILSLQRSE